MDNKMVVQLCLGMYQFAYALGAAFHLHTLGRFDNIDYCMEVSLVHVLGNFLNLRPNV